MMIYINRQTATILL